MKPNQKSKRNGIQDILFPMEYMNIVQGNNGSFSHQGVNALDLAGKDRGRDVLYAPFDVQCVATDPSAAGGNAAFWQSSAKVRFADGTIDYATIMIVHDNSLQGIYLGAKYAQGIQIAQEGTAGNATGNHLHLEIAKGKFTHLYDQNAQGNYHLPKSIPCDLCAFIDNTTIINNGGMKWKKLSDVPVDEGSNGGEQIDQILHIGSHAKFTTNKMTVTHYDAPTNSVFLKEIDAWAYPRYLTKIGNNQILYLQNVCYFTSNYFTISDYDKPTGDVYLKEASMWAHPKDLTEIA